MRRVGHLMLGVVLLVALLAPWLAPNAPDRRFPDLLYAPPTQVHLPAGDASVLHVYPWQLVNRLERRFSEDRERPAALAWFANGRLVSSPSAPLLLLGADSYGRDVLSRLLYGARLSLALAIAATAAAIFLGALVGLVAGFRGGMLDEVLSRGTDFVLVLPAMYVVLALRAAMPLIIPPATVFAMLTTIFAVVGAPIIARGVRAIVLAECEQDYVIAARATGAGPWRLMLRHLLPAARGHMLTQGTLLLPAFILAEATLSYVGLGFPDTIPTWGTMLADVSNGTLIAEAPWMLAPAGAIFIVVLAVNLAVQGVGTALVQLEP